MAFNSWEFAYSMLKLFIGYISFSGSQLKGAFFGFYCGQEFFPVINHYIIPLFGIYCTSKVCLGT